MSVAPRLPPGAEAPSLDHDHPWPGLLSFGVEDRKFFRGREKETLELSRRVMRERLTVLFGRSGLGKTSLLRAGLFPRLQEQNVFPVYIRLDHSPASPDLRGQILAAIESHAAAADIEFPRPRESETLWEYFHRRGADFWTPRNRPATPLLVFDQFEEIFTLGQGRIAETEAIVAELADLAEGRPPAELKARLDETPEDARHFSFDHHPYKILLSLREDYLPELERLRDGSLGGSTGRDRRRWRGILDSRFRLCGMDGDNALAVVTLGGLVEPDVAGRIVRFVAAAEDGAVEMPLRRLEVEPALLSVVCRSLNERRLQRGASHISSDDVEGSRDQILIKFYEDSVDDLGPAIRVFIEEHLLTRSGYRNRVAREDAEEVSGVTSALLGELVARRLLRIEEQDEVKWVELTHDLLTPVIAESRDRRRRRAAQRRRWALTSVAIVGTLLVAALFLWMFNKAQEQRQQRASAAQAAALNAAALLEADPLRSLDLAREAVEATFLADGVAIPASEEALHRALERSRTRRLWSSPMLEGENEVDVARVLIALSADGRYLAAPWKEGAVAVWDSEARSEQLVPDVGQVDDLALTPDGRYLATVARATGLRFWDLESRAEQAPEAAGDRGQVRRVHFSPAGDGVAIVDDRSIRLLKWPSLSLIFEQPLAPDRPGELFYSQDGRHVAMTGGSGVVVIREAETGDELRSLGNSWPRAYGPVSFSRSGLVGLATGTDGQKIRLWPSTMDSGDDELVSETGQDLPSGALQVAFSPSGRSLAAIDRDTLAPTIWDLPSSERSFTSPEPQQGPPLLSVDGSRLVTRTEDGLSLWELVYEAMPILPHQERVRIAQFDRLGKHMATLDRKGTARLWDVASRTPKGKPPDVEGIALSFHPDGKQAVIAEKCQTGPKGGCEDGSGEVAIWDLETGRWIRSFEKVGDRITVVGFDRSGDRFATGSADGKIGLFEAGSEEPLKEIQGSGARVRALAFDSRGRLASASENGTVELWSPTGDPLQSDCGHDAAVYAVAFDPAGARLASGGNGGVVRICDLGSSVGSVALPRGQHADSSSVRALAFSPDGKRLASGGTDRSVVVWSVDDRLPQFRLPGSSESVTSLDYSPDGRALAIASWSASVRLEIVDIGELLRVARERLGTPDVR